MADEEVKDNGLEDGGEGAETPAAEEGATSIEKPATETSAEQEKKYTDEDMKALRLKYQKETREERDRRIELETELRIRKEMEEKKGAPIKEEPSIPRPTRPIESDFNTREEYNQAIDKYEDDVYEWRKKVDEARTSTSTKESEQKRAQREFTDTLTARVEEGRKSYTDFDTIVTNNNDLKTTPAMLSTIVKRKDAADLFYYLGSNPAESLRIAQITDPAELAMEVGEIAATVRASKKSGATPPAAAKKTGAPKPPATVGAKTNPKTDTSLEGKTQAERLALLEQRSRENRIAKRW